MLCVAASIACVPPAPRVQRARASAPCRSAAASKAEHALSARAHFRVSAALRASAAPAARRRVCSAQLCAASASAAPTGYAKMHDFCLTLPYGAFVALGGLIGFLAKGSVPSLVAGAGSGVVIMLLGVLSLKAWKTGVKGASTPYTVASAGLSLMLTAMMGKKYLASRALFPPGVFAGLSAAMLLFYLYNLASGGNPPSKKTA